MTNESDHHEITDSDCLESFDHLYAYLNGELTDKLALAKIEHHLAHCRSCYSRAQMERQLNNRIKQTGKDKPPSSLQKRLRDLMKDF